MSAAMYKVGTHTDSTAAVPGSFAERNAHDYG